ncbi:MAG: hypothetical protein ACI4EX_09215 [Lachnospiraceae bacterium]
MKRISLILFAFLMILGDVCAENLLTVNDVTIPSGSKAAIEINCDFDSQFKGYQFDIDLDEGVSLELDEAGKPVGENGFATDHIVSSAKISTNKYRFVVVSLTGQLLPLNGTVLRVFAIAEEGTAVGSSFSGKISAIEFTTSETEPYYFDEIPFSLTVGEPVDTRTVLDEESSVLPATASGVDVRVKRTIKANTWSSIVLPFAMTSEQMKTAFGEDVEAAEFTAWETTDYDDDDNPTAISVSFTEVNAIEANTPYIIKVSSEINEFVVDGVDVEAEEEPCVTVGKTSRGTFGSFTGSYVPMTLDEECVFLSDNKFWYSTGLTQMKGYRGYFYFQDVLGSYYTQQAVPMRMSIIYDDGTVTYINSVDADINIQYGSYNLNGMRINNPTKGLVIKNGKKYLIK